MIICRYQFVRFTNTSVNVYWFVYFNKMFDYIFDDYYVVILQDDDGVIWKNSWLVMLWYLDS